MDESGNLFGATYSAFELIPGSDGWRAAILHNFTGHHGDGRGPFAGVILDAAGNLYGTTELGGSSKNCDAGCGTVYQLRPQSDGTWKETTCTALAVPVTVHSPAWEPSFSTSMAISTARLIFGGPAGYGTVFMLSPQANGYWKETILHSFSQGANGDHVSAGVVMDQAGILYGTTIAGGTQCDCGVVYKLAPQANGKWTYTVLHRFNGGDGDGPDANLILDQKGNLYGTAPNGGFNGGGVVFEITP